MNVCILHSGTVVSPVLVGEGEIAEDRRVCCGHKLNFKYTASLVCKEPWLEVVSVNASLEAEASPGGIVINNPPTNAGDARDTDLIPG